MEALYGLEDQSQEQRAYMILVCLVIITQDKLFNQNIHHLVPAHITTHDTTRHTTRHKNGSGRLTVAVPGGRLQMLGEVTWYKERYMRDISLGSLLVVVLVRTVHVTLSSFAYALPSRTHIIHCSPRLTAHARTRTHNTRHDTR